MILRVDALTYLAGSLAMGFVALVVLGPRRWAYLRDARERQWIACGLLVVLWPLTLAWAGIDSLIAWGSKR